MPLSAIIVLSALGTTMLPMAAVWMIWSSRHASVGKSVNVTGDVSPYLRRRHSPPEAPSRP